MNREIKFRAWDKQNKRMGYFAPGFGWNDEYYLWYLQHESGAEISDVPYGDNIVLMQYTGLKDRHGKEIYEGDVLRGNEQTDGYGNGFMYRAVVEWDSEMGRWIAKEEDETWSLYDYDFEEVIGNIYEHEHLLTNKRGV